MLLQQRYDTSPLQQLAGNICYAALSVAYLKRHNVPIALHTDTIGKLLFGFLPYDEIITSLDAIPYSIHPRFWAAGKVWAMEAEGVGSVHIDIDVFIKTPELAEKILTDTSDAIVQNYESGEWNSREAERMKPIAAQLADKGIASDSLYAFNTGTIGINNQQLLEEYSKRYKFIATLASRKLADNLSEDNSAIPDLVAEQANFLQCCRQMGMSVTELLPPFGSDYTHNVDKGYQHVLGCKKYQMLPTCLAVLKAVNPDIYAATLDAIKGMIDIDELQAGGINPTAPILTAGHS